ncbi:MAG: AmpG family muropeptide MFS transporter [Bdellovibrionia bacterium]
MKSILTVFSNRRMMTVFLLGFSSGVPLSLVGSTLQAWMVTQEVDLAVIGIFSLVGLPYTLKFFWAPALDRFIPPFLGRRRGWILIAQLALVLSISAMALFDPALSPGVIAALAVCVAFFSASQDIVVDAYKTEILVQSEYGIGAAVSNLGYRLAMLFSGAFALILADHLSWGQVYLCMAAAMSVGIIANIFSDEPPLKERSPRSLKEAVIEPLKEFFRRTGVIELVVFIVTYKLDVVMTLALMTAFMLELGFTKTEIGAVSKGFGLVATIVGTFVGGAWFMRLGMQRSLWIFGILQGISSICFIALAKVGHNYPMMVAAISSENFFSGMGNAAYSAFLMSLCNPKFTATQFALLTSLMALTRTLAGTPTGWLAKAVGWETYYIIALLLMIPSLLLLTRFKRWQLYA